jgi:hypothetical protein
VLWFFERNAPPHPVKQADPERRPHRWGHPASWDATEPLIKRMNLDMRSTAPETECPVAN